MREKIILLVLTALGAVNSFGQIVVNQEPKVQLSARDTRAITVTPNTASALIEFNGDPRNSGGDVFDVSVSDARSLVSLILPSGVEVNATNAPGLGLVFSVIPAGSFNNTLIPSILASGGTHTLIVLPGGSVAGKYKVRINTSATPGNTVVVATYYSSSLVRAALLTDSSFYKVGDTVLLFGLLFNGGSAVPGVTVKAKVADPTDAVTPPVDVNLQDSGGFDAVVNDGIYTGTYTASKAGKFAAAMQANGNSGNVAFSRTAVTEFRVVPVIASFQNFADAGIDDDFNTLFDRIVVTANINVVKAGKYAFGIQMSKGATLITGSVEATLTPGSQQMAISFPAAQVLSLGADGPFDLKKASLIQADDPDAPLVDYRENAGQTKPYTTASLQQSVLFFTGSKTVTPIDNNGNKKFDILRITAGVSAATGGFYQWSARLVDPFGKEIDFFSSSSTLQPGAGNKIDFDFNGRKIGQNARNGPYSVRSVLLFGAGNSLVVEQFMQTDPYSVLLFEGATCPGDLNGDKTVDAADLNIVRSAFGKRCAQAGYNSAADINQDCFIDVRDLSYVSQNVGCKTP